MVGIPKEVPKTAKEIVAEIKGKKILVIDDEPDFVAFLQTLLEDNDFEVITATSGAAGLEKARSEKPDLITLDVTMPGKSGVQVYRDIRLDPDISHIPICIITGVVEFRQLMYQKTVQAPEGFLRKPIDNDVFLATVNRVLEKTAPHR